MTLACATLRYAVTATAAAHGRLAVLASCLLTLMTFVCATLRRMPSPPSPLPHVGARSGWLAMLADVA